MRAANEHFTFGRFEGSIVRFHCGLDAAFALPTKGAAP